MSDYPNFRFPDPPPPRRARQVRRGYRALFGAAALLTAVVTLGALWLWYCLGTWN